MAFLRRLWFVSFVWMAAGVHLTKHQDDDHHQHQIHYLSSLSKFYTAVNIDQSDAKSAVSYTALQALIADRLHSEAETNQLLQLLYDVYRSGEGLEDQEGLPPAPGPGAAFRPVLQGVEIQRLDADTGEFGATAAVSMMPMMARHYPDDVYTMTMALHVEGMVDFHSLSIVGSLKLGRLRLQEEPAAAELKSPPFMMKEGANQPLAVSAVHVRGVARSGNKYVNGLLQISNGSNGIPELLKAADATKCRKNLRGMCERGTVEMDPWVNRSLAFQRQLALDTPLNRVQFLGTHNSFNNKADGFGNGDFTLGKILEFVSGGKWEFVWAQQWFTMTDQLNTGARHLMLDPVYLWGAMRLCHCGTTFKWFDDVLHFLEKVFNTTLHFNSDDLGCMPYDRHFDSAIQEIANWVTSPGREKEFVIVYVNDEGADHDWGHLDDIWDPIKTIFGDLLFTPADKQQHFGGNWPTTNQLVQLGKRVMVTCSVRCANDSHVFLSPTVPAWDGDTMKHFTPYPKCGGFSLDDWYLVGGESQVVGPIYNGPKNEGLVVRENLPYLLQCPVSVSQIDILSPSIIEAAVWSWAKNYSLANVSDTMCVVMDANLNGHWRTASCNSSLPCACKNTSNPYQFTLSSTSDAWYKPQCPLGFVFSLPTDGYGNHMLYLLMLESYKHQIWLNLNG